MHVLLESALRITILMGAVGAGLRVCRVSAPRSAHRAWTGVCLVMLALPAIVAWAPRAGVAILPPATGLVLERHLARGSEALAVAPGVIDSGRHASAVSWGVLAAGVYGGGVALLLCGVLRAWWRSRAIVRQARLVGGRLAHPRCVTPITAGVLRPVVILPDDWETWDPRDLGAVVAHEEEHVRRRDTLVALLTLINRAVFWFHPLAWWLRRQVATLSEQACDAVVMGRGYDSERYASMLLGFARAASAAGGRLSPPAVGMSALGLRQRLDLLQAPPAPAASGRRRVWRAAAYAAVAAACAVATPTRAQSPSTPSASDLAGWQAVTSEHFDVRYLAEEEQRRVNDAVAAAEQAYARLAVQLEYEPARRTLLVVVGTDGDLRAGAAAGGDGRPRVVLSLEDVAARPDAPVHELTHRFAFEIVPTVSRTMPWLMEGLAEHERGIWDDRSIQRMRAAVREGDVPNPDALTDMIWGHALFDYVAARWGEEGVRQLLFALRTRPRLGDAIQAGFSVARSVFAEEFAAYAWARFGPQQRP